MDNRKRAHMLCVTEAQIAPVLSCEELNRDVGYVACYPNSELLWENKVVPCLVVQGRYSQALAQMELW